MKFINIRGILFTCGKHKNGKVNTYAEWSSRIGRSSGFSITPIGSFTNVLPKDTWNSKVKFLSVHLLRWWFLFIDGYVPTNTQGEK